MNHDTLRFQHEYAGVQIINLRILVCHRCHDELQPQLRAYAPPPDPLPIRNPRPELSQGVSVPNYLTDEFGNVITDDTGAPIWVQP